MLAFSVETAMSMALTTHWSEHDASLNEILQLLTASLSIFDTDLLRLRLEQPENVETLRAFLGKSTRNRIRIVLKDV